MSDQGREMKCPETQRHGLSPGVEGSVADHESQYESDVCDEEGNLRAGRKYDSTVEAFLDVRADAGAMKDNGAATIMIPEECMHNEVADISRKVEAKGREMQESRFLAGITVKILVEFADFGSIIAVRLNLRARSYLS